MLDFPAGCKTNYPCSKVKSENFYDTDMKCDHAHIFIVLTTDGHDEITKSTGLNAGPDVVSELKVASNETLFTVGPLFESEEKSESQFDDLNFRKNGDG